MRKLLIIAALATLALIGGCDLFLYVAPTITPETQTLEIVGETGYVTAAWKLTGKGEVYVDFGDGSEDVHYSLVLDKETPIWHEYTKTGTYTIVVLQAGNSYCATLIVTVEQPIVRIPAFATILVPEHEKVSFNIPYRERGCNNGTPVQITGISPGAGVTEFRLTAYREDTGEKISLFDCNNDWAYCWGEWLPLIEDLAIAQPIACWALWSGEETPIPMVPVPYPRDAEDKGCGCGGDDDWEQPTIPENAIIMTFTLEARNEFMGATYPSVTWCIGVLPDKC